MCFEWSIFPMALKFLPHGQLISLVKRQKSNLDREERKRACEIFFRMVTCTESQKEAEGEGIHFLRTFSLSCALGEFLGPLGQPPSRLNTLRHVKKKSTQREATWHESLSY